MWCSQRCSQRILLRGVCVRKCARRKAASRPAASRPATLRMTATLKGSPPACSRSASARARSYPASSPTCERARSRAQISRVPACLRACQAQSSLLARSRRRLRAARRPCPRTWSSLSRCHRPQSLRRAASSSPLPPARSLTPPAKLAARTWQPRVMWRRRRRQKASARSSRCSRRSPSTTRRACGPHSVRAPRRTQGSDPSRLSRSSQS